MNAIRAISKPLFGKYLFVTNTVSAGILLGAGDSIVQTIEGRRIIKAGGEWRRDWKRTGRMIIIGLVLQGPTGHVWYGFLDRILKGKQFKTIAKKILLDQMIASPFFAFGFLMGMGLLEGQSWEDGIKEFKSKFWTVYMADWTVWPAAQCINFYFLPPKLRVLYVNMVTLVWDVFLSYIKHDYKKEDV